MEPEDIVTIARAITHEAEVLDQLLRGNADASRESGKANPGSVLWDHSRHGFDTELSQSKILGLIQQLNRTLRGPRDYLHELVSCNWDKGALYCLLEHSVFEHIPLEGEATLAELAEESGIPDRKLLPMLRLVACEQVVIEQRNGVFKHGPISRELIQDAGLKAFIGFQLYETRVASAHLADSLKRPNPFWTGQSAFEYAWGQPMYGWHKSHPEKGARFAEAMKSVANSLDPGNQLLESWFSKRPQDEACLVVDLQRQPGPTSQFLGKTRQNLRFTAETIPQDLRAFQTQQTNTDTPTVYVIKSVLWGLPDDQCIAILQTLAKALEASPNCALLVNDLLSPLPGLFEPHVDKAYRRRDVTVMTMHNAKLRTREEWIALFREAGVSCKGFGDIGYSSHSCRGQWELRPTPHRT